jgi:omega-amidase
MQVGSDKAVNLQHAAELVASTGSSSYQDLVLLPECFNGPYATQSFPKYAEVIHANDVHQHTSTDSPSVLALAEMARSNKVYLVGGSIPEKQVDSDTGIVRYYNTCLVFNREGEIIAKHRKKHLFDVDIPDGIRFMESDVLSPGTTATTFDVLTEGGLHFTAGLGICFDIRFPGYAQELLDKGADMLLYPGAFNTTTGPLHWELLQRARAVDTQSFVVTCSPARSPDPDSYQAWGHSSVVSPWGRVLNSCAEHEQVLTQTINLFEAHEMRKQIPINPQVKYM